MSELNLEYINNIVTEIEAVHTYIDTKIEALAKYAEEKIANIQSMSEKEKAAAVKYITEKMTAISNYVNDQMAAIKEKITKYLADLNAAVLEQLAILKPIMSPPTSINAVISWATSVANYFAGPYYKLVKMQAEILQATITLLNAVVKFTSHDHFAPLKNVLSSLNISAPTINIVSIEMPTI